MVSLSDFGMLLAQSQDAWAETFFGLNQEQRFVLMIITIGCVTGIICTVVGCTAGDEMGEERRGQKSSSYSPRLRSLVPRFHATTAKRSTLRRSAVSVIASVFENARRHASRPSRRFMRTLTPRRTGPQVAPRRSGIFSRGDSMISIGYGVGNGEHEVSDV